MFHASFQDAIPPPDYPVLKRRAIFRCPSWAMAWGAQWLTMRSFVGAAMTFFATLFVSCVLVTSSLLPAQQAKPAPAPPPQPPPRLNTPEVHSDNSVTFRFRAPNAQEVKIAREGTEPVAMQKDDQGVWTVNTPPLSPDYYGYSIIVDGVRSLDPNNSGLVPNLISPGNFVHVAGPPSLPWELNDVPHGEVHHHFRSEEHTSELQSLRHLVCRLLLEKKKKMCHIDRNTRRLTAPPVAFASPLSC